MALTQVRAKLGDEWVTLTYNEATGRYEGTLIPPGTSIHQPGGYFNLTAEAANENGEVATISGEQLPALRLVVRETAAPTLTLISPPAGYLNTASPVFVFEAVDEPGGSGVDPNTFTPAPTSMEAITNGYRCTWTPETPWGEGPHTVTVSVRDYDRNESTVSAAYIVDTVPPQVILQKPDAHRVVDVETALVAVDAWDVSGVSVEINGKPAQQAGDRWSLEVPLDVGENNISVAATDGAGNRTSLSVYMIRLITDRAKADVSFLESIYQKPMGEWPEATLAWFNQAIVHGAYNDTDLNRVGVAVRYLAGELRKRGYSASVSPKTDWTMDDAPTNSQMVTYLTNVETIRQAQGLYVTEIPGTMRGLDADKANRIEKALVETDSIFPRYTAWTAGEITCGGV